ncbi:DUF680 domain-containing protein [Mesorhizobium sp. M2C.T.Ca.TU.002.02.1.1]|jgi:hypothetical protein|uniref:DUF680 domain-containing protein n=1 Tax=Mesorhizobium sp. M2C.T.Ca.TU.002.02.1.1 TaxID=2496788 RepID=UPI000FCB1EE4|nr:DUF680 domain-containing protein [Mesorhizobium sp. M2C.T.Ca.TU.002.02.1.1]RUU60100.1 DUF680 domain-containing protein [Mesorhizobium sp. M2C.T.Ca.TU.002.02.1.1]RUU71249.1 DUF680 domain-containing protein [Mesorhizobium sp. M2C.T.Ca.TU.009.01.2.1]
MKKIVLATAALLAVSGAAFAAESGHTGEVRVNQAATAVDTTRTSSINTDSTVYKLLNSSNDVHKPASQGSDRNLFGR